ncbi:MAG: mobile mystery protein B [Candidatus Dormibacteraceae bacterium]
MNFGIDPDGATPLGPDDIVGLRRSDIVLRAELNRAEAENIAVAMHWAFTRRPLLATLLTQRYLKILHRRMFGEVWKWASQYRKRESSIGIAPYRISTELENLLLDIQTQTADLARLPWPADEIAVRFHHRLVSIHPWPNGNGRHARLATDLLVIALGQPRFTWGHAGQLRENNSARTTYLSALRIADKELQYVPLLTFARS